LYTIIIFPSLTVYAHQVGRFHPFYRPRRPLRRVDI
jgi:hypothetical protein